MERMQEAGNTDPGIKSEQTEAVKRKNKRKKPKKDSKNAAPSKETVDGIETTQRNTPTLMKELQDSNGNATVSSARQKEIRFERNVNKLQSYINSSRKTPIKKTENADVPLKPESSDAATSFSKDDLKEEKPKPNIIDGGCKLKTPLLRTPLLKEENSQGPLLNPGINLENVCATKQSSPEKAIQSPSIVTHSEVEDTVRLTIYPAPARPQSTDSEDAESVEVRHVELRPVTLVLPREELAWFKQQNIYPLKVVSPRFPRAVFHCRLCSFHISSIAEVYRHIKDERHVNLQRMEMTKRTANLMPDPSPAMIEIIGQLVENVYNVSGLLQKDLDARAAAVHSITQLIESNFPGLCVRTYGSYVTGLGLQNSNVNLSLVKRGSLTDSPGLIIISILNLLRSYSSTWGNVEEDFNCRVPIIHFEDLQQQVKFSVVVDNDNAYQTTLLLREYQRLDRRFAVLTVAFRIWACICELDRPELGTLPAHAYSLLVLYFMQQHDILPVLHRRKSKKEDDVARQDGADAALEDGADAADVVVTCATADIDDTFLTAAEFLEKREPNGWSLSPLPLGKLWLDLLKFYAFGFGHNETAVCVRTADRVTRASKNWGNRRLAIEDPFHTNVNMASPLGHMQSFDYFQDAIRIVHNYFWTPQTQDGPLYHHLIPASECATDTGTERNNKMNISRAEAETRMKQLKNEDLFWIFHPDMFLPSYALPVICNICTKSGHTKAKCPELDVPKVGAIPPPDVAYFGLLDIVCWNIFRNFSQQESDQHTRKTIRGDLERFIRSQYPDASLTLYGSSCNGFGMADSDVDMCLMFESNADGSGLDMASIVSKLAKLLRKDRHFCDVVPITSAKVPIVKLRHRLTNLESDISLYNQLGRRNSQLLATYSAIDPRVRILGYMAKLLAKQCQIGDASRGSLSSYAYILLVLHYLQQVNPPVIPVLQEIEVPGVDKSKFQTEGWNTWFFEDVSNLGRVWPHCGANREPPSTLWLGFLLYYAEVFDYRQRVVTIRQKSPLYRLEKMWTDRAIGIEDPFDLNHNLGSGLSLRMGAYIRRVFVAARRFFQTPVRHLPPSFKTLEAYLFNAKKMIPFGPPPNDRGCLICGKVGHKAKECPFGRNNRRPAKAKPSPQLDRPIVRSNNAPNRRDLPGKWRDPNPPPARPQ